MIQFQRQVLLKEAKMKRIIYTLSALLLLFTVSACGGGGGNNTPSSDQDPQGQTTGEWDNSTWNSSNWGQ